MDLAGFVAEPFAARRTRLAARLGGQPALLPSGEPRARNYAANTYPFRGVSHFLYLCGLPLRGAYLRFDGEAFAVYARAPEPDDALWHGPEPGLGELAAALGCPVRPLEELPASLAAQPVATLPAPDLETCQAQGGVLGRSVRPGALAAVDEPLADAIIDLRLHHDPAAIAELRAAATATAAAHAEGMAATRPGIRESTVRAAMEAALITRGMTVAYGSIVTVHGEVLHNEQHHHLLGERDMVLADVGAETAGGWAGDVTRTWPVSGRYSSTQRDLYDVVLAAQTATIAAVRPGVRYRDLHLLAARKLAEGLCALGVLRGDPAELVADGVVYLLFPHGIGHLLGLDVHDMEDLGDRAGYAPDRTRAREFGLRYLRLDRDLAPGMAVTIEPGLYLVPAILADATLTAKAGDRLDRRRLAQFSDVRGIRIEDDVLVTAGADGHEVLTAAIPKTREAIEERVGG
jgi:Xaa-Pro aminopeptidase